MEQIKVKRIRWAAALMSVFVLAATMASAMAVSAASPQVDMDYEGAVDIYTGEPLLESNDEFATIQLVSLPDGGSYDRTSHFFVYRDPNGGGNVQVTVADGMVTTQTVSVVPQEGMAVSLYRDGQQLADQDISSISEPGVYSLLGPGGDDSRQIMTFTIVAPVTGDIKSYALPAGFYVTSFIHNGEEVTNSTINTLDLSDEGDYDITYRCQATGVDYSLQVTLDHIPPRIEIEGVENGKANGPVTVSSLPEGETFTILRDGTEVNFRIDNVLRESGSYELVATDLAGNVARETFVIGMYLNNQGIVFFLLTVGIIAAAIGFMVYSRKRLRIR